MHFYYGMGPGKTSITLGRIIRALGHGLKPILIQFLKKHDPSGKKGFFYGEYITLTELLNVPIMQFGNYHFVKTTSQVEANRQMAADALQQMQEILHSDDYDLIVLDELGSMIELNLYSEEQIFALLASRDPHAEIIITGHQPIEKIIEIADYVTHLQEVKHPFQQGIQAREGIEY